MKVGEFTSPDLNTAQRLFQSLLRLRRAKESAQSLLLNQEGTKITQITTDKGRHVARLLQAAHVVPASALLAAA